MDTIKFEKRGVMVIAHRGLSGLEVENTCSAFVGAGNRSYYGIETDIHRTADGHFAINYDDNFSRVAGIDKKIEELTLEQIRQIILFDKNGEKSRNDLRPACLEEYLSICKKYEKHAILELKSNFTDEELSRLSRDKIDIDVWCNELSEEQIKKAHSLGLVVNCWTVNEACDGERLALWGIDYITTNILE